MAMRFLRAHVILLLILALLAGARIAAPWVARGLINGSGGDASRLRWHVQDVDIHLWKASYDLKGADLYNRSDTVPVFSADRITSSLRWQPIFRSAPTMGLDAYHPQLRITHDPGTGQRKARPDWEKILGRISLFRLSRFGIHGGEVRFRDHATRPEAELEARDVDIDAENLFRGGEDSSRAARLEAKGLLMGSGHFDLRLRLQPEAARPTFTLDFSLADMELRTLGTALGAYAGLAVVKGRMDLAAHAAAAGGRYHGTVRSALHDFEMAASKPAHDGLVKTLEKKAVRVAGKILQLKTEKNESEGKRPPKADFSGDFPESVQGAWSSSGYVLREAFHEAMKP